MNRFARYWVAGYYAAMTLWCVSLTVARADYTWLLVAVTCTTASLLNLPRVRMGALMVPAWMATRAGKWLARRSRRVSRLWIKEMQRALIDEQEGFESLSRIKLLVSVNIWANGSDEDRQRVIETWVEWRNCAEHLHRLREELAGKRLELPPSLWGMPRIEELWKRQAH